MAIYNEILAARFSNFLMKHFGMKGENPAKQLSGELMPAITLPGMGVDGFFHMGWQKYGVYFSQAAVAAQNSAGRFRNPAGSRMIAVIESLVFANVQAAGNMSYGTNSGPSNTDLGTLVAPSISRWDARGKTTNTSMILSKGNNDVGIGTPNKHVAAVVTSGMVELIQTIDQELPILPGDVLQFFTLPVNVNLDAAIQWRERPLEESELF